MRVFLLPITYLVLINAHAQMIEGIILDSVTGKPISYASIMSKKNPSIGTVANVEGSFRIDLGNIESDVLIISHTGYVTKEVSPKDKFLSVKMIEREVKLKEIVVTPTDPLLDTLRKAYSRIPINYPGNGTLIKGIYRETNQQIPDSIFDYFSEALLDVYKTSYSNKEWGTVKIIEGGIIDNRNDSTDILFYGGPFAAHKRDFVKERIEFINPRFFDRYTYTIIYHDELYEIQFVPERRAMYQGSFYLDKKSLAYIGAEFSLTNQGIESKNNLSLRRNKYTTGKYTVRYKLLDGVWQLSVAIADGTIEKVKDNSRLRFTSEYFAISHEPIEKNPFSDSEAAAYGEVYSKSDRSFTQEFWNKPEVVRRTVACDSMISSTFKLKDRDKIRIPMETASPKRSSLQKIKTSIATRISSSVGLSNVPVDIAAAHYNLSMTNNFVIEKRIESFSLYALNFDLRFFLTRRVSFNFHAGSANSRLSHYNHFEFGANWHKRTGGFKRPFIVEPGLNLNYFTIGASLGQAEIRSPFRVNNKEFSEGTTKVYYGERRLGIGPTIQYRYSLSPKLSIFAKASTTLISVNKNVIFFKPKGIFTSVRSVATNDQFILLKDNIMEKSGPVSLSAYGVCFNGGIQFGIN